MDERMIDREKNIEALTIEPHQPSHIPYVNTTSTAIGIVADPGVGPLLEGCDAPKVTPQINSDMRKGRMCKRYKFG